MTLEERLNELTQGLGRRFAEERDLTRETVDTLWARYKAQMSEALLELKRRMAEIKDGKPGPPGPPGKFLPPEAWKAGVHYANELASCDGSTWVAKRDTAERPPHDDWALVALAGKDGVDGRTGEARGKHAEGETYQKLDRVSFNGSEWIARRDDPGPLPGEGWMLGAQKARGKPGPPGPPGTGLEAIRLKDWSLQFSLTDGSTVSVDLRTLFERYDKERG
jgi:hypothetical protein